MSFEVTILDKNENEVGINISECSYTDGLNMVGTFNVTTFDATENDIDNVVLSYQESNSGAKVQGLVYFYKSGSLEFKGYAENVNRIGNGQLSILGTGTLGFLRMVQVGGFDHASEQFQNRIDDGAGGSLIPDFEAINPRLTGGVLDNNTRTVGAVNFAESGSYWTAIRESTYDELDMDLSCNYQSGVTVDQIDIEARAGSATTQLVLVEGIDISNTNYFSNEDKIINRVHINGIVLAGSKVSTTRTGTGTATYSRRDPVYSFYNKRIEDSQRAVDFGDRIISNYQDPPFIFACDVNDPNTSFALGDKVEVTSKKDNLTDVAMRIYQYTRTITSSGAEKLSFILIREAKRYNLSRSMGDAIWERGSDIGVNRDGSNIGGSADRETAGVTADRETAGVTNDTSGNSAAVFGAAAGLTFTKTGLTGNAWGTLTTLSPSGGIGSTRIMCHLTLVNPSVGAVWWIRAYCQNHDQYYPRDVDPDKEQIPLVFESGLGGTPGTVIEIPGNHEGHDIDIDLYPDVSGSGITVDGGIIPWGIEKHTHQVTEPNAGTGHDTQLNEPNAGTGHDTGVTGLIAEGTAD